MIVDSGKLVRYGPVVLLWLFIAFGLTLVYQLVHTYDVTLWFVFLLTVGTVPVGGLLSQWLLNARVSITHGDADKRDRAPARLKTSDLADGDLRDMLHLLNEHDLDDLRAELREAIRMRIRAMTSESEFESFENLLAQPQTRKRAKRDEPAYPE